MKKVFGLDRSTPTQLILSKFNLYSFEQRVNLKLYVLVYRCLTHHVSPLLTSLLLQRALGPNTRTWQILFDIHGCQLRKELVFFLKLLSDTSPVWHNQLEQEQNSTLVY